MQSKEKIIFLTILFLGIFGWVGSSFAANYYFAQGAVGNGSGDSCANAYSAAWFNDSNNWANPKQSGKIGPGDTAHLCGTISSYLTVRASGTSGSPITILFESGARLSNAHWNGANNNSAIYGGGLSNIIIDGGMNGIIEATDNGTNKTYQLDNSGIFFSGSSNITIKNLLIQHIYDRVEGTETNAYGRGVYFGNNLQNITVQDNEIYDARSGIFISFRTGDANVTISGNRGSRCGAGCIVMGSANNSTTLSNVNIYGNEFYKGREWSGSPPIHTNLIHLYAVHEGSRIDGLKIYNNKFSGKCGTNSTSLVFLEGNVYSPRVYNNLLIKEDDPGGACGNGMMYVKRGSDSFVVNNTFISNGTGIGFDILGNSNGILKNNIFFKVANPVISPYDTTSLSAIDNNIYYNLSAPIFNWGSYGQINFSQWLSSLQNSGLVARDLNSITVMPSLDSNFIPTMDDAVAKDRGTDLSSYFNADKNGVLRPQGSAWDIGAYEYVSGGDTTPPVAPMGLSVS